MRLGIVSKVDNVAAFYKRQAVNGLPISCLLNCLWIAIGGKDSGGVINCPLNSFSCVQTAPDEPRKERIITLWWFRAQTAGKCLSWETAGSYSRLDGDHFSLSNIWLGQKREMWNCSASCQHFWHSITIQYRWFSCALNCVIGVTMDTPPPIAISSLTPSSSPLTLHSSSVCYW